MKHKRIIIIVVCITSWIGAALVYEHAPYTPNVQSDLPIHYRYWDGGDPPFICDVEYIRLSERTQALNNGGWTYGVAYWHHHSTNEWSVPMQFCIRPMVRITHSRLSFSGSMLLTSTNEQHLAMREQLARMGRDAVGGMPLGSEPVTTFLVDGLIANLIWWALGAVAIVLTVFLMSLTGRGFLRSVAREQRQHRLDNNRCGHCGYDLRGSSSDLCPECGATQ